MFEFVVSKTIKKTKKIDCEILVLDFVDDQRFLDEERIEDGTATDLMCSNEYRTVWDYFTTCHMEKCLDYKSNNISLKELAQCLKRKEDVAQLVADEVFNYIKNYVNDELEDELEDDINEGIQFKNIKSEYKVEKVAD